VEFILSRAAKGSVCCRSCGSGWERLVKYGVQQYQAKNHGQSASGYSGTQQGSHDRPIVVAISRNMPIRMLEKPSRT